MERKDIFETEIKDPNEGFAIMWRKAILPILAINMFCFAYPYYIGGANFFYAFIGMVFINVYIGVGFILWNKKEVYKVVFDNSEGGIFIYFFSFVNKEGQYFIPYKTLKFRLNNENIGYSGSREVLKIYNHHSFKIIDQVNYSGWTKELIHQLYERLKEVNSDQNYIN
jgi:hypothetical protein